MLATPRAGSWRAFSRISIVHLRPVLLSAAALAAAGALALPLVVVPNLTRVPADLSTTSALDADVRGAVLADALLAGDAANAFAVDTTATIDSSVVATGVDGDVLTVEDRQVVTLADGRVLSDGVSTYTADVVTRAAPEGDDREGLVLGFPTGLAQDTYTLWSSTISSPWEVTFVAEEVVEGTDTYHFEGAYEGVMTDAAVDAAGLPTSIDKQAAAALLPSLPIPDFIKDRITQSFDLLPAELPLSYDVAVTSDLWIEPTTGLLVDVERTETRTAVLTLGDNSLDAVDVIDWTYGFTDAQVTANAADAADAAGMLTLATTTAPIGLGVLAAGLLVAGLLVGRRRSDGDARVGATIDLTDDVARDHAGIR